MCPSDSNDDASVRPPDRVGEWRVLGSRQIYDSSWVRLMQVDVVLPSGERNPKHHVVTMPSAAMAVVLNSTHDAVLLAYRHRFVSNVWNWELPGGLVDDGESASETAAREIEEETGYRAGHLAHLVTFEPMIGMVSSAHHIFLATDAQQVADPTELDEGTFQWVPLSDVPSLIDEGQISNSGTLIGLLHYLAMSGRERA